MAGGRRFRLSLHEIVLCSLFESCHHGIFADGSQEKELSLSQVGEKVGGAQGCANISMRLADESATRSTLGHGWNPY